MCTKLEDLVEGMRSVAGALDVSLLSGARAVLLVESLIEAERAIAAARTVAMARVLATGAWRTSGASSAVTFMADRLGSSFGHAASTLATAQHLDDLPALRGAFVEGRLSEGQAAEIAVAAAADPGAEESLVALAEQESLAALRERCRDVVASAAGDEDAGERIRRGRYFRHRLDRDGAIRLDARLAPEDAAPLLAEVRMRTEKIFADARRSSVPGDGRLESLDAYAADALVSLAGGGNAPKATVHVHVSASAMERGHTVAGETCRIEGVGPITVGAARRLASGGVVKVLETDGVDIRRVAHAGRVIPAHLRTALETRDPTCVVPKCNRRMGLEIDHIVPYRLGGPTAIENLARLCRWHHAQKTHHGWVLGGAPGHWTWSRRGQPDTRSPPDRGG